MAASCARAALWARVLARRPPLCPWVADTPGGPRGQQDGCAKHDRTPKAITWPPRASPDLPVDGPGHTVWQVLANPLRQVAGAPVADADPQRPTPLSVSCPGAAGSPGRTLRPSGDSCVDAPWICVSRERVRAMSVQSDAVPCLNALSCGPGTGRGRRGASNLGAPPSSPAGVEAPGASPYPRGKGPCPHPRSGPQRVRCSTPTRRGPSTHQPQGHTHSGSPARAEMLCLP